MDATTIMSVSAVAISIIAVVISYVSYKRTAMMDTLRSYFELERDSDTSVYSLLIQNDSLNKLFYEKPKSGPPDPSVSQEDMTPEDRAILNFAEMVLDYFEQLVLLDKHGVLPQGIGRTWEPWIGESVRAPYFVWAWSKLSDKYHPELHKAIHRHSGNDQARSAGRVPTA